MRLDHVPLSDVRFTLNIPAAHAVIIFIAVVTNLKCFNSEISIINITQSKNFKSVSLTRLCPS